MAVKPFSLLITILGGQLVFEDALADDTEAQRIIIDADQHETIQVRVFHIEGLAFEIFENPLILQRQFQDIVIPAAVKSYGQSIRWLEAFVFPIPQIQTGAQDAQA